jgi:hypothetical protein
VSETAAAASWLVWAKALPGLTPTQRLVVLELARLADGRGVAIVSIDHLMEATGRSRMSVFRALAELERAGRLSRQSRRRGRRQAPSRFQLHRGHVPVGQADRRPEPLAGASLASMARTAGDRVIDAEDNEGLREAILSAQAEGWRGESSAVLAATIVSGGGRQFHAAIARGRATGRMGREEAELDTLGVAWEALRLNADKIAGARNSWAMWTTIVANMCRTRDACETVTDAEGVERPVLALADPFFMPEEGLRPGQGASDAAPPVGIDDFEGRLTGVVDALVVAGMDETRAWAGTLRVVELAVDGDKTRRATMAAKDVRLADLGIPSECARRWMTLLAGARRGTTSGIVDMAREELSESAAWVVEALRRAA